MTFTSFTSLAELVEYIKTHKAVWYQAPLDIQPHQLIIRQYTICNGCKYNQHCPHTRMTVYSPANGVLVFTMHRHLDRFRNVETEAK